MSTVLTHPTAPNKGFVEQLFSAQAVSSGGVIRRSVVSVEREIGRRLLAHEVKRRGFHLLECGDQFIIVCRRGDITLHF